MYFIVNLKMEKPMLCCCFIWIVFIELNFTVAFLLIRKTWDDQFTGKVGGWGIWRNGVGDPIDEGGGGNFWNGGVDTPLRTMLRFRICMVSFWKENHLTYCANSADNFLCLYAYKRYSYKKTCKLEGKVNFKQRENKLINE